MSYNIISVDPRPAQKEAMISLLDQNAPVVGIEFTLPALLPYVGSNIDGQHFGGEEAKAAIELALSVGLPSENTTLAIVRADADAIGAVAVLNMRLRGQDIDSADMIGRVAYISRHDRFDHGAWQGPKNPDVESNDFQEALEFKALSLIASNFKADIVDRVSAFEDWLSTGDCPGLIEAMDSVQNNFKAAIVSSNIVSSEDIAIVESTHRGATELAYCYAPVAIIKNDAFRFPGVDGTHLKYTICQFQEGYVDLRAVAVDLNEIESGWGGSDTIVGSPQGVSSDLTMQQVIDVVFHHLL